jgi:hypothetical protein
MSSRGQPGLIVRSFLKKKKSKCKNKKILSIVCLCHLIRRGSGLWRVAQADGVCEGQQKSGPMVA